MSRLGVQIESVTPKSCHELVHAGHAAQSLLDNGWPVQPGAVSRTTSGQSEALHWAPGRWLLPEASAELLARLADRPDFSVVDVEGKWQQRVLRGRGAWKLLAAAADVEAMLEDRDCAALSLFDCPVVVARAADALELWVHSSYAHFLDERLNAVLDRMMAPRV